MDDGDDHNEQRELFAVSAVAFAMKHDAGFKRHFLKRICGVDNANELNDEELKDYNIQIQPYVCADLALENNKKSEVIVLEFKVGADLKPHQNYTLPDFSLSESESKENKDGYGKQIRDKYSRYAGRQRYIIFLEEADFVKYELAREISPAVKKIQCFSRTWSDLLMSEEKIEMHPLVEDLFYCLAENMNIGELKGRLFMDKELVQHTQGTIDMYGLLSTVAKQFGAKHYRSHPEANLERKSFGFWIQLRARWAEDFYVWLGYETTPQNRIAIWICNVKEQQKRQSILEKLTSKRSAFPIDVDFEVVDQSDAVIISSGSGRKIKDQKWFVKALEALDKL